MSIADYVVQNPRLAPMTILLASAFALGFAYTSELAFGYEPCVLCLYQRVPYAAAGLIGMVGVLSLAPRIRAMGVLVAGIAFLIGAAIAFYHVGVEQHWWASAASCGGAAPTGINVNDLMSQLQVKPEKACDAVDWTLFGISMATYNVAASLVLSAGALIAGRGLWRAA